LQDPFDCLNARTLLKFTRDSYFWNRLGDVKPQWDKMPTKRAKELFAVEDLGHGAEGRCWLVCSKAGLVAVLKFFRTNDPEASARGEKKWWDSVYPELGKSVRVEKWGGHWALVMPHLSQSVERDEKALAAVRKTLQEDYAKRGIMQPVKEVKWRNIGFYKSGSSELRAVVFDMSHVTPLSPLDGDTWVTECMEQLEMRCEVRRRRNDEKHSDIAGGNQ
jgi:hypothetical protein